jgi:hypothetical protein
MRENEEREEHRRENQIAVLEEKVAVANER